MEYAEIEKKSMDRILYKEQSLDNCNNRGEIEGKPGKRRPRIPFLKRVIEDTGIRTYRELKTDIDDREKWK